MNNDNKITFTKMTTFDGEQNVDMIVNGEIVGTISRERPMRRATGNARGLARDMSQPYLYTVEVNDIEISVEDGANLSDVKKAMVVAFTA
jgi:hypothetical protein